MQKHSQLFLLLCLKTIYKILYCVQKFTFNLQNRFLSPESSLLWTLNSMHISPFKTRLQDSEKMLSKITALFLRSPIIQINPADRAILNASSDYGWRINTGPCWAAISLAKPLDWQHSNFMSKHHVQNIFSIIRPEYGFGLSWDMGQETQAKKK